MNTFAKLMVVLDVNIDLCGAGGTVQEKCILDVQEIFLGSTEEEARYLAKMVECMAEHLVLIASGMVPRSPTVHKLGGTGANAR